MPEIVKLTADDITKALKGTTRQYLVGLLQRPQKLAHINDGKIEIGITRYEKDATEQPHSHKQAFEYQYVIRGKTAYLDVETSAETEFAEGDFYMIKPGTVYAQKSIAGTEILFIKMPPGNDKMPAAATPAVANWFKKPIQ